MRKIYESKNFIEPKPDWKPKFYETFITQGYYIKNNTFHLLWGKVKIKSNFSLIYEIKDIHNGEIIKSTFNVNKIMVHCSHTELNNGKFSFRPKEQLYHNCNNINVVLSSANANLNHPDISYFIDRDFCKLKSNSCIAEIGVKLGLSSLWFLQNISNCKLDLFESDDRVFNIIRNNLRNYPKQYTLYEGRAEVNLDYIDKGKIYDIVFFDVSHNYSTDIIIFKKLLNHINENTIVIFDDYNIKGVQKLVNEVVKLKNFKFII